MPQRSTKELLDIIRESLDQMTYLRGTDHRDHYYAGCGALEVLAARFKNLEEKEEFPMFVLELSEEDEIEHKEVVREIAAEYGFPLSDWQPTHHFYFLPDE